jgi:hypothetical protein
VRRLRDAGDNQCSSIFRHHVTPVLESVDTSGAALE